MQRQQDLHPPHGQLRLLEQVSRVGQTEQLCKMLQRPRALLKFDEPGHVPRGPLAEFVADRVRSIRIDEVMAEEGAWRAGSVSERRRFLRSLTLQLNTSRQMEQS